MTEKEYIERLRDSLGTTEKKSSLTDDELLGLLLSHTDCKDRVRYVVSGLVSHFGTARRCFSAKYHELVAIDGMTRHAAILILLAASTSARSIEKTPIRKCKGDFSRMFLASVNLSNEEELWAAALDDNDMFSVVERLAFGTEIEVGINMSSIISFAGRYKAKRIILAHSHPDIHDTGFSKRDEVAMEYIAKKLKLIGIELVCHVVVSGRQAAFFRCEPD